MTNTHRTNHSAIVVTIAVLMLLSIAPLAFAGAVEKTDGFVCPVFNDTSAVGAYNPNAVQIAGGDYTIVGPSVSVPLNATNDNGAGSPGGAHVSPGDPTYSAIWSGQ